MNPNERNAAPDVLATSHQTHEVGAGGLKSVTPVVDIGASLVNAESILKRYATIREVKDRIMEKDVHYGTIGNNRSELVLLKPGAEVLASVFQLSPDYRVTVRELSHPSVNGHREYEVVTMMRHIPSGAVVGGGVGMASSMEIKYRYRGADITMTDQPVPKAYWDVRQSDPKKAAELLGGKGRKPVKDEERGGWYIGVKGDRKENEDVGDLYNTLLKIAKKRSYVDAVITATGCSHLFTQDVNDPEHDAPEPDASPAPVAEPRPAPKGKDRAGYTTGPVGDGGMDPRNAPAPVVPTEEEQALLKELFDAADILYAGTDTGAARLDKMRKMVGSMSLESIKNTTRFVSKGVKLLMQANALHNKGVMGAEALAALRESLHAAAKQDDLADIARTIEEWRSSDAGGVS